MRSSLAQAAALALWCAACGGDVTGERAGVIVSAVVYGSDDRRDVRDEPDATLGALATASAVALAPPGSLRFSAPDAVTVRAATLRDWDDYCDGTPFLDQPTAATCSGVLIDDDLVLTAGHCLDRVASCRDYDYVFDYALSTSDTPGPSRREEVFGCRRIAARTVSAPDSTEQVDFAIVQLDRSTRRTPALPATMGVLTAGDPLTVIGFPSGLPAKIDDGPRVVDPRTGSLDYFSLTSDTFTGSSGSGVFDANERLVGVFARGTTDFVDRGNCRAVRTLPSTSTTSGELATRAERAVAALCAARWPSERLCGTAPRCGDGVCGTSEDAVACPSDCTVATCGDGLCEASEWTACSSDCGDRRPLGLPDDWNCEPSWYDDGAVCDCRCGASDPDCHREGASGACESVGPAGIKLDSATEPPLARGGCSVSGPPFERERSRPPSLLVLFAIVLLRRARDARVTVRRARS